MSPSWSTLPALHASTAPMERCLSAALWATSDQNCCQSVSPKLLRKNNCPYGVLLNPLQVLVSVKGNTWHMANVMEICEKKSFYMVDKEFVLQLRHF